VKTKSHLRKCTYCDSGEQTFRHISHNDTNQENDSIQPIVTQDEGNDKERYTKEDGHSGDDVDEMGDLTSNGCLSDLQSWGKVGNTSHDGSVSGRDDNSTTCSLHSIGGEESDVPGLKGVLVSTVRQSDLWLGFSGQGGVVYLQTPPASELNFQLPTQKFSCQLIKSVNVLLYLESMAGDNTDICRNSVTKLNLNHITDHELFGTDVQLVSTSDDNRKLQRASAWKKLAYTLPVSRSNTHSKQAATGATGLGVLA